MRKTLGAIAVVCALTLSACGQGTANGGYTFDSDTVELPDGRTVTCVFYSSGGASCDWENAK